MPATLAHKIKAVLKETGLTQAALAEVLGVSHQRVRNLAAGRVRKFEEEEAKALVHKLHIRGAWLVTGEGPIRQPDEEIRLGKVLEKLRDTTEKATSLGLSQARAAFVRDVLFAVAMGDTDLINSTLDRLPLDESSND